MTTNNDKPGRSEVSKPFGETSSERRSESVRWNAIAIASFVLGVLPVVPVIGSVTANGLGIKARGQIESGGERGAKLANWGIGLGVVWVVVTFAYVALVLYVSDRFVGSIDLR